MPWCWRRRWWWWCCRLTWTHLPLVVLLVLQTGAATGSSDGNETLTMKSTCNQRECLRCDLEEAACVKCLYVMMASSRQCVPTCPPGHSTTWPSHGKLMGRVCTERSMLALVSGREVTIIAGAAVGGAVCVGVVIGTLLYMRRRAKPPPCYPPVQEPRHRYPLPRLWKDKRPNATEKAVADEERAEFLEQLACLRGEANNFLEMLSHTRTRFRSLGGPDSPTDTKAKAYRAVVRDLSRVLTLLNRREEHILTVPGDWRRLLSWAARVLARYKRQKTLKENGDLPALDPIYPGGTLYQTRRQTQAQRCTLLQGAPPPTAPHTPTPTPSLRESLQGRQDSSCSNSQMGSRSDSMVSLTPIIFEEAEDEDRFDRDDDEENEDEVVFTRPETPDLSLSLNILDGDVENQSNTSNLSCTAKLNHVDDHSFKGTENTPYRLNINHPEPHSFKEHQNTSNRVTTNHLEPHSIKETEDMTYRLKRNHLDSYSHENTSSKVNTNHTDPHSPIGTTNTSYRLKINPSDAQKLTETNKDKYHNPYDYKYDPFPSYKTGNTVNTICSMNHEAQRPFLSIREQILNLRNMEQRSEGRNIDKYVTPEGSPTRQHLLTQRHIENERKLEALLRKTEPKEYGRLTDAQITPHTPGHLIQRTSGVENEATAPVLRKTEYGRLTDVQRTPQTIHNFPQQTSTSKNNATNLNLPVESPRALLGPTVFESQHPQRISQDDATSNSSVPAESPRPFLGPTVFERSAVNAALPGDDVYTNVIRKPVSPAPFLDPYRDDTIEGKETGEEVYGGGEYKDVDTENGFIAGERSGNMGERDKGIGERRIKVVGGRERSEYIKRVEGTGDRERGTRQGGRLRAERYAGKALRSCKAEARQQVAIPRCELTTDL